MINYAVREVKNKTATSMCSEDVAFTFDLTSMCFFKTHSIEVVVGLRQILMYLQSQLARMFHIKESSYHQEMLQVPP